VTLEQTVSIASVGVAVVALFVSSLIMLRHASHMEAERNAMAMLEAVKRITDPVITDTFERLVGIETRYPTDEDVRTRYPDSQDQRDMQVVSAYIGAVGCLARRGVIDPSLLADAVGLGIRRRWAVIREFVLHARRANDNPYILEHFEWLAMYCAWWKDVPRPKNDRNFDPDQFAGVTFEV